MIVLWKQQRIKVIPIRARTEKEKAEYKGAPSVTLLPGMNNIPDETWDFIKPLVKDHLAVKNLVPQVVTTSKEVTKKVTVDGKEEKIKEILTEDKIIKLADMSPEEVETVLKETISMDSLKEWKKEEKREDVRNMIQDRIKDLEAELKKNGQES